LMASPGMLRAGLANLLLRISSPRIKLIGG
jgi:hypothetical protein